MKKVITVLFFIILVCDTLAIVTENQEIRMIFKPLLMPLLVSIYLLNVGKKASFLFVSALFFSFWGDLLLLFKEFFIFGLASFLLTHVFYITIISKFIDQKISVKFIKWSIPFLLYFSVLVYLIYPNLKDLVIPVLVYGTVISIFGTITLVNYLRDKSKQNFTLLIGAFLFIISDSCIAINQFYNAHIFFEFLIIVLYGISQYLICKVMIYKNKSNKYTIW